MMSVQDDYFGPSELCGHGNLPDVCHHCKYEKEITTLRQQLTEAQERVAELEKITAAAIEWFESWDGPDEFSGHNGEQKLHDSIRRYLEVKNGRDL